MKIKKSKLITIIKEQVLKEYYRGFVQDVQKLGFVSLYDAALSMVSVPEYVELLGTDDAKKISTASSDRYGLSYVLDKWKEENPGKTADDVFPQFKRSREKVRQKRKEERGTEEPKSNENEPEADVPTPEEAAAPTKKGSGLTSLKKSELNTGLNVFRNTGLKMGAKDFLQNILDRLDKPPSGVRLEPAALKVASKVAGEISKIIDGDLSNLKESKRRKK